MKVHDSLQATTDVWVHYTVAQLHTDALCILCILIIRVILMN